MNKPITYYENEALKLKSLLAVMAASDPDNTNILYELLEVAKMAHERAESLYCAIADEVGNAIANKEVSA